ncbi:hypothetical protein Tco_0308532 [Tanacetum coccineum]
MVLALPLSTIVVYKVPILVLFNHMERLRRDFFYGVKDGDRKIAWIKWTKVLASKKFGGLGVSSLFALNRALIFKWVWRFLSHDNFYGHRVIAAVMVQAIILFLLLIQFSLGFWNDLWIGDNQLKLSFPRLFALEVNKDCSVADKLNAPFTASFRRQTRGVLKLSSLSSLRIFLIRFLFRTLEDRCLWDLNGEEFFNVKDGR